MSIIVEISLRKKTCFKNPHSPSCIGLIITNTAKNFQNSTVIETCLSDFHKMLLTVLKIFYKKQRTDIFRYRNYRNFDNELFMNDVEKSISRVHCHNQFLDFETFKKKVDFILEKHGPLKYTMLELTKHLLQIIMANTKKYLQSDRVRGVQYWSYLCSVFNLCTLLLNNNNKKINI